MSYANRGGYFSITFRFIGLLGDFKDGNRHELETVEEKENYMKKCLAAIEALHKDNPSIAKILVTADSPSFLKRAKALPYVYIVPGNVVHMDNVTTADYNVHLKLFLDFLMVSNAEKCYSYYYGRMFRRSKFAKTAALIGGKEYIEIVE